MIFFMYACMVADTPARSIIVQLVDEYGYNITTSLGENVILFQVYLVPFGGKGKEKLEVQHFDQGDGTYRGIFFFNKQVQALHVTISLVWKKKPHFVAKSPYLIPGPITFEKCNCPRPSAQFFSDYTCSNSDPSQQVEMNVQPFVDAGIGLDDIQSAIRIFNANDTALVHYTILNNVIYSKVYGKYPGFQKYVDETFLSLRRRVHLPDIEFLVNMGDWPVSSRFDDTGNKLPAYPVFSWCGSTTHYDMVLPTYKMTQGTVFGTDLEELPRMDGLSFKTSGGWDKKIEKLFFRGRPSNIFRVKGMEMTRQFPAELDIQISKNQHNYFPDENAKVEHRLFEEKYGSKAKQIPILDFFKYKYLLNLDGTVAAYRLGSTLAGDSVVFIQESDYYEHYYRGLVPWVHYIPVNRNISDIRDKVFYVSHIILRFVLICIRIYIYTYIC